MLLIMNALCFFVVDSYFWLLRIGSTLKIKSLGIEYRIQIHITFDADFEWNEFILPMKKFQLLVILLFLLFAQKVYSGLNKTELPFAYKNESDDRLNFETNEFFYYSQGDLPSAQVFFNIIPEVFSSPLSNNKTKDSGIELFLSNTKINQNLSIHQASVFSRYCSAFVNIYLKTECFRL